jgi:hypothetical protein
LNLACQSTNQKFKTVNNRIKIQKYMIIIIIQRKGAGGYTFSTSALKGQPLKQANALLTRHPLLG